MSSEAKSASTKARSPRSKNPPSRASYRRNRTSSPKHRASPARNKAKPISHSPSAISPIPPPRPIRSSDAASYARIYNYYIRETIVTFEEEEISEAEALRRIQEITLRYPWFVCEDDEQRLLGYAYARPFKTRRSYRRTVEVSIYLDKAATGAGLGTLLMQTILDALDGTDCHMLIGGVALPNDASVRLHEKFGFEKVAHFKEVGCKFEKWIDVAYWQKRIN